MPACDIHPWCRDQGCEADPNSCQFVLNRNTEFAKLDDMGRWRRLQYHLRSKPGEPVPAAWVEWLLIYVRPPKAGPGVIVESNPEKPSGWVRDKFERE